MKNVPTEETSRNNTKVIIILLVLLAILILITVIVFYVLYVRRRNFKKQGKSTSTIKLFTIKLIFYSHTKFKSRRLLVILTFAHRFCSLEHLFPSQFLWGVVAAWSNLVFRCRFIGQTLLSSGMCTRRCKYSHETTLQKVFSVCK